MSVRKVSERVQRRAEEVGAAFLAGESPQQIADRFGIDRTYVYKFLRYQGISPAEVLGRRREAARLKKEQAAEAKREAARERKERAKAEKARAVEAVVNAYRQGETTAQIAKRLGVSRQRVQQRLKDGGVSLKGEWEHIFSELDFLCGTDSFEGLCERLRTKPDAVREASYTYGYGDIYARLSKTRIDNYYTEEDQNAA